MSRLEEIKARQKDAAYLLGGTMIRADWNWLIEQAERVQELEKENENLLFDINHLYYHRILLENQRYKQALEFYADEENYELDISYNPAQAIDCMILDDSGHQARKALGESK